MIESHFIEVHFITDTSNNGALILVRLTISVIRCRGSGQPENAMMEKSY